MIFEICGFIGLAVSLYAFTKDGFKMRVGAIVGCSFFLVQAIATVTLSLIVTNVLFIIIHLLGIKRLTKRS
jgi:hypothetical protein